MAEAGKGKALSDKKGFYILGSSHNKSECC